MVPVSTRIIDLRPGTYTVTFTLTGFATVKREGLELPADFVSTVNGDMKIGTLEETINVAGESPIVDVQTTTQRRTLDLNLIQGIPTARGYAAVMLLIPSMVQSGGGNPNVQLSAGMIVFGGRGGRQNEGQSQLDGLGTGAAINGGGVSGYGQLENAQEVVMTTAGGLGEAEVGGPIVNMIPKTGGNSFQNHFYGSGMSGWMQSDNYSQLLQEFSGVTILSPQKTNYLWDISMSNGGPIVRDRLWFFFATQWVGNGTSLPGMFYNKNAGDITKWTYEPDLNRPAENGNSPGTVRPTLRLTAQVTAKDKLNMFWDPGAFRFTDPVQIGGITGPQAGAPETGTVSGYVKSPLQQIRWTSTRTSRLLLEAGLGTYQQNWNGRERPGNNRDLIPVTEQCTAGCPTNGNLQNLVYRAQNWNTDYMSPNRWNVSATYVTGAHNMKAGYIGAFHSIISRPSTNNHNLAYRFNNGIPNQITQDLRPYEAQTRVRMDALYAQDQWTRGRLTLQGAIRYDKAWSYYPEQQIGATRFMPVATVFPESKGVLGYHDIDPRFGVAYDLFGNGKTALKFNMGRYLEAAVGGNGNYSQLEPRNRITNSVTRTWTDQDRDFNPDCDLSNGLAQDLRASGGDFCGAWNDQNFGKPITTLSYDEQIMKGWYNRPSDWIVGATVQHELMSRVSLSVGYTRRWLQNFTVTDNLQTSAADFTPFSVTAPLDPRLPGGGGYVVSGLYNVVPAKASLVDNFRTYNPTYGNIYQVYNGVDLNVAARLRNGLQLQVGTNTGQRVTDYCEVRTALPEQIGVFSTGSELPAVTIPSTRIAITSRGSIRDSRPPVPTPFRRSTCCSARRLTEQPWHPASRQLDRLKRRSFAMAGSFALEQRAEHYSESAEARRHEERPGYSARLPRWKDPAIRKDQGERLSRPVQCAELRHHPVPNQAFIPGGAWLTPTGTQTPVMTARTAKFTVQYDF